MLVMLASAIGCGGAPEKQSMTVYSLDPVPIEDQKKPDNTAEDFHGFAVLAKVDIAKEKDRNEILQAIENGMKGGRSAKCFDPRHGIHFVRGDVVTDYVICFSCSNVSIYQSGQEHKGLLPIDKTPHDVLQRHLGSASEKK